MHQEGDARVAKHEVYIAQSWTASRKIFYLILLWLLVLFFCLSLASFLAESFNWMIGRVWLHRT